MIKSQAELKGRRVALFGLSANPPTGHSGHLGIVRFLVQTGLFDEIWVLPVYQHMFAAKRSMIPFEHRVEMCHRCMDDESTPECRVRVMEIEKYAAEYYEQKKGPEYRVGTVDILDYIHDMCPGLDLHLVLGTDTYKDLIARKWKQADRILSMVTVHAISRLGIETTGIEIVMDSCLISIAAAKQGGEADEKEEVKVKVVHHKVPWLTEVSSSLVRRISASIGIDLSCLVNKNGEDELTPSESVEAMRELLDERVLRYIKEHGLYGYTSTPTPTTVTQETQLDDAQSQGQRGDAALEAIKRAETLRGKGASGTLPSAQPSTVRQVTQEAPCCPVDALSAEKQKRLAEDAVGYAARLVVAAVVGGVEVGGGSATGKRARI